MLGRPSEAIQKISDHLSVINQRLADNDREEYSELNNRYLERQGSVEQTRMELKRAYQLALFDTGKINAVLGNDALAFQQFMDALMSSPRAAKHVIDGLLHNIQSLIEKYSSDGSVPESVFQFIKGVMSTRGSGSESQKNVIFVVDYSGSMAGGKIRRAREGVLSVINAHMQDDDMGALITFSNEVKRMQGLIHKGSGGALVHAVERMTRPNGATALWDAIHSALQLHTNGRDSGRSKWIVVCTDGGHRSIASPAAFSMRSAKIININILLSVSRKCDGRHGPGLRRIFPHFGKRS